MTRVASLRASDPTERVRALAELGSNDGAPTGEEMDAVLECLADGRKLVQRRTAEACATLLRHAGVAIRVRAALVAPDPRLRWGAAYALALAGDYSEETLDVLAEVLGCNDGDLRWAALDMFKRHAAKSGTAVAARLTRLAASGTAPQRKMALYGLRDLNVVDPIAASAAEAALGAAEPDVRLAGIATLGRLVIDRQRAAAALLVLLEVRAPPIQRAAAAALGALGITSTAIISALARARDGADDGLRRAAERSLQLLGKPTG